MKGIVDYFEYKTIHKYVVRRWISIQTQDSIEDWPLYYLNREVNPHPMVGFRSDLLNDKKSQRRHPRQLHRIHATRYFGSIMFRPEIRFDHSWDRLGYNNGTARNQFFLGGDLIYKF